MHGGQCIIWKRLIGQRRPIRLPSENKVKQTLHQATQTNREQAEKVTKEIGSKLKIKVSLKIRSSKMSFPLIRSN